MMIYGERNMGMKKIVALAAAGVLATSLVGCSQNAGSDTTEQPSSSQSIEESSQNNLMQSTNTFSANGLSFKYPSDWIFTFSDSNTASLSIPGGGFLTVCSSSSVNDITYTEPSNEELDRFFEQWFKDDASNEVGFYKNGDQEKHYNTDDLYSYQITPIRFRAENGKDYYGYSFVGIKANEAVAQYVGIGVEDSADEELKAAVEEIASSITVDASKVDLKTVEWSKQFNGQGSSTQERTESTQKDQKQSITVSQQNALRAAKNYIDIIPLSRQGLIDQLVHDQYSTEDATYAADNCGADWMAQAVKSAQNYVDIMPFSHGQLVDQLVHDGFTQEEAEHGVSSIGL